MNESGDRSSMGYKKTGGENHREGGRGEGFKGNGDGDERATVGLHSESAGGRTFPTGKLSQIISIISEVWLVPLILYWTKGAYP